MTRSSGSRPAAGASDPTADLSLTASGRRSPRSTAGNGQRDARKGEPKHSRDGLADTDPPSEPPVPVRRLRLLVCCVALMALAFYQDPGQIIADTKLDLTIAPADFLARALHLWEPRGAFGQVQNQSYGYLFPIGPFFLLGDLAGLDPWVVQRLWLGLLMIAAFLGVYRLCRALEWGTYGARVLAGFAFALTPRLMTVLGPISIEALPTCLAPWVLLPLVLADRGRLPPRRAAALSGLVIAVCGGVNAVAVGAALVLPAIWLFTRAPGSARRRLVAWWLLAVVLAIAWWLVPLLLLGRYSPPFLDFIESSATTTAPTTLVETLRGTSHWVGFLSNPTGPVWRGGWLLVHIPVLVVDTVVIAAVGLYAVARRGMPERPFLVLGVLSGLVLVTFGHVDVWGPLLGSPFAELQRVLLDGPLAPLRNVHKFDVVLRLPLILAAAHLIGGLGPTMDRLAARLDGLSRSRRQRRTEHAARRMRGRRSNPLAPPKQPKPAAKPTRPPARPGRLVRPLVALGCVVAVIGGAVPAMLGQLAPEGSFRGMPDYWRQTATWLSDNAQGGRALLVPGSRFGEYRWGRPRDEPMQPLARSPWAVRDAIPLTPPGTIRMLDAVQASLASGRGSPALADYLARAGVGYVVVRNDLDRDISAVARPVLVHRGLESSPGITKVASFGPVVGPSPYPGVITDRGLDLPYNAVEVYAVRRSVQRAVLSPLEDALVVAGGPESVLKVLERGWARGRPVLLAGDVPAKLLERNGLSDGLDTAVTDTLRRREVAFGGPEGNSSATLAEDDPLRVSKAARDYLPDGAENGETVAQLVGARRVTSSSSAADPDSFSQARPANQPFAALDGFEATAWRSQNDEEPVGQWLEVELDAAVDLSKATVRTDPTTDAWIRVIRVTTDRGAVTRVLGPGPGPYPLGLGTELARRIRITVVDAAGGGSIGISDVDLPNVEVRRTLRLPDAPNIPSRPSADGPAAIAIDAGLDRPGCVFVGNRPLCTSNLTSIDEELAGLDRTVDQRSGSRYTMKVQVASRTGAGLEALLAEGMPIQATASSSDVPDSYGSAVSAVDGTLTTGWVAKANDRKAALQLRWRGKRKLTGLTMKLDPALAASRPRELEIKAGNLTRKVTLDSDGEARFDLPPVDALTIRFTDVQVRTSVDPVRRLELMPVGVSEVRLHTDKPFSKTPPESSQITLPCGSAPSVVVDGRRYETKVTMSRAELRRGETVDAELCQQIEPQIREGVRSVRALDTAHLRVVGLSLEPVGWTGQAATPEQPADVVRWGAEQRTLKVPERDRPTLLTVRENTNPGWVARLNGRRLQSIVVDGWQQAWVLPAGAAGQVQLSYEPGRPYRIALLAGGALLVLLLGLALIRRRHRPDEDSTERLPVPYGRPRRMELTTSATGRSLTTPARTHARLVTRWLVLVLLAGALALLAAGPIVAAVGVVIAIVAVIATVRPPDPALAAEPPSRPELGPSVWPGRWPLLWPALAAGGFVVAGAIRSLIGTTASHTPVVQALCGLSVLALLVSLTGAVPRRGPGRLDPADDRVGPAGLPALPAADRASAPAGPGGHPSEVVPAPGSSPWRPGGFRPG